MSEKDNSAIIKEYNRELSNLDNVEIAGFRKHKKCFRNIKGC